jgi:hypothetical protein
VQFTPEEYRRVHQELLEQVKRVQTAYRAAGKSGADAGWAESTIAGLAAELRRAEAERQAQQPDMDSTLYYPEWLLVRVERGEIS